MRDRARPRRAVELVQYVLSLLLGPTHVVTLRLLWLALLFYGERGVFHDAANRCQWPEQALPAGIDARPPVHILLVTDPQIIDRDTYPSLPFPTLLYPVVRHFSDNYLKNVWTSLAVNPNKWMMRENILPWQPRTQDRLRPSTTLAQPPDAVVWMGDLTDGGRRHRTEQEWAALVLRFRSIFWRPREADWEAPKATLGSTRHLIVPRTSANMYIPTFHLSGNHDIGLPGTSTSGQRIDVNAADDAIERFNRDFGMKIDGGGFVVKDRNPFLRSSLNGRILASTDVSLGATHELVLVNAQDLVGMQRQGGGPFDTYLASAHQGELDGALGTEAHRAYNETYEFVDSVKRGGFRVPRVLLTHVPLYRPEGAGCDDAARSVQHGVTREAARPLHQGTDRGSTYQNMVSESVSDWVLRSIDPAAVFSGDDHDHCEYRHRRPAGPVAEDGSVEGFALGEIPELTVKSVSMTEGVRRPGFARLSLFSPPESPTAGGEQQHATMAYTPCLLPDQIGIWTKLYLPAFVLSLVLLAVWPRRAHSRNASGYLPLSNPRKRDDDDDDDDFVSGNTDSARRGVSVGSRRTARRWGQDLMAVIAVALPFWIVCQTHLHFLI